MWPWSLFSLTQGFITIDNGRFYAAFCSPWMLWPCFPSQYQLSSLSLCLFVQIRSTPDQPSAPVTKQERRWICKIRTRSSMGLKCFWKSWKVAKQPLFTISCGSIVMWPTHGSILRSILVFPNGYRWDHSTEVTQSHSYFGPPQSYFFLGVPGWPAPDLPPGWGLWWWSAGDASLVWLLNYCLWLLRVS